MSDEIKELEPAVQRMLVVDEFARAAIFVACVRAVGRIFGVRVTVPQALAVIVLLRQVGPRRGTVEERRAQKIKVARDAVRDLRKSRAEIRERRAATR